MTYTTHEVAVRDPVQFANETSPPGAQLDPAHIGHIRGGSPGGIAKRTDVLEDLKLPRQGIA